MPTRTKLLGVVTLLFVVAFAASVGWSLAAPPARARAAQPAPAPQREMARAAGEVLRIMQEQEDIGGRALTPELLESKLEWSRRRVMAVRDSDPTRLEESNAIHAHLDLAKRMRDQLQARCTWGETSRVPYETLDYYVAEAELWLARAEGRAP